MTKGSHKNLQYFGHRPKREGQRSGEAKGRGDLLNRISLTDREAEAQHLATNVYYISVMTCVYDFFKPPPSHSFQTWCSCHLSVFERGIPSHLSMTPQLCKYHRC